MEKTLDLKNESILKLFFNYLIPAVSGMLIMSLHVLIDGIFVGRGVGSDGLAAVNIVVPFYSLFTAIGLSVGLGGATVVAIKFGEGKNKEASSIFTQSLIVGLVAIIIIAVISEFNIEKISYALGANEKILPYVRDYMKMLLYFSPVIVLVDALSCFVRNDGAPRLSMYAMIVGAIINGILNYVFIFKCNLGLSGSALATGIANLIGLIVLLMHFLLKNGNLRIVKTKIILNDLMRVCKNGLPSFFAEMCLAVVTVIYNIVFMKMLGELGVSAYSVINYIHALMLLVFMGIAQAVQPIISYNYGAEEKERVKSSFKLALIVSVIFGVCFFISGILFGQSMIKLFNNDNPELMKIASTGIKIYFVNYLFMGVNMVVAAYFQAVEKAKFSTIITICRGFIFNVVGLLILPKLLGVNGVWLTTPIAELATIFICFIFLKHRYILNERSS